MKSVEQSEDEALDPAGRSDRFSISSLKHLTFQIFSVGVWSMLLEFFVFLLWFWCNFLPSGISDKFIGSVANKTH